jgi:DNA-binding CsgD family transcriptional regulator
VRRKQIRVLVNRAVIAKPDCADVPRKDAAGGATSTPLLPPRLRRTLERLLAGESDKEIAQKLGISRHTVHEYVGDLYRRFGVSGRGELMAMLLRAPR